jgi:hypothetical protein
MAITIRGLYRIIEESKIQLAHGTVDNEGMSFIDDDLTGLVEYPTIKEQHVGFPNEIVGLWMGDVYGVAFTIPSITSITSISGIYIIAKDKIRILFSTEVSKSHELLKESTYSLYNNSRGTNNVIKEVMPLPDKATDYVDLRISNITWGESYTFSIGDDLIADIDGLLIPSQEVSFIAHRTKVDNILKHMPDLYDAKKGNIRTILEAIGLSDNDIGGSTTEESTEAGESIGSGTYGTSTYGTDTYGG